MMRILLATLLTAACAMPIHKDYSKLLAANPRAILIVPALNKSVEVDAPDYFLSALSVPLAERGYYVFPVNLVKRMLEDDGLSDAALVHGADPIRLCNLFGADAVLYATIERWTAKYILLSTQVEVEFNYVLKDGKTGDLLWEGHEKSVYQSNSGQGLLADVIMAAITKAKPNYMDLARGANSRAVEYPGPGLPAGPYRPEYRMDVPEVVRVRGKPATASKPDS